MGSLSEIGVSTILPSPMPLPVFSTHGEEEGHSRQAAKDGSAGGSSGKTESGHWLRQYLMIMGADLGNVVCRESKMVSVSLVQQAPGKLKMLRHGSI